MLFVREIEDSDRLVNSEHHFDIEYFSSCKRIGEGRVLFGSSTVLKCSTFA